MTTTLPKPKCIRCRNAPEPGRKQCTACLEKAALRQRARYVRKGTATPRTYRTLEAQS